MKPLFLSMVIVGAISLWYSNAHADQSRHGFDRHDRHQLRHQHHFSGHGYAASRYDGLGHRSVAWHSSHGRGIDQRQWDQRRRIAQASHNGQLTRGERRYLLSEQRAIAAKEMWYRSDGRLTAVERWNLHADLALANRHIYNESHDSDRR